MSLPMLLYSSYHTPAASCRRAGATSARARASWPEDQVSPRLGILQQPIEVPVAGDVKAGYYEIGMLYRCTLRRAVGREQMLGVNDARLQLGIKGTAIEGVEKTLVGTSVG